MEVHPRDPYHRVDTFSTSRHVAVSIDGLAVAVSTRAITLYETSLPVRFYLPPADIRMELLELSPTMTECPYKGTARHWSARLGDRLLEDVAWQYDNRVRREAEAVTGLLAFYDDKVEIVVDGQPPG